MVAQMKYPPELRERAVRLYRGTRPRPVIRQMARDLGVHPEALRGWIRADEKARGQAPGGRAATTPAQRAADEREELRLLREQVKELERENVELRRANEILKVASAFFARQLDPIRR
ncbi:MAG TPA: transposase [Actinocrinis sp.]|jgi:transposase